MKTAPPMRSPPELGMIRDSACPPSCGARHEGGYAKIPVIDATLKGPDAVFALLHTYWQRLEITQADHVLFIADGAPWIWKRVPLLVQA